MCKMTPISVGLNLENFILIILCCFGVINESLPGGTEFPPPGEIELKDQLKNNENKFWNNLDNDQRKALLDLANDPSVTIKPADKGGSIVIMNTDDYIKSCLNSLWNPTFYEELPTDPNPK